MPEKIGSATGIGHAADGYKFNIQAIKGFDCYLAYHWLLPNSNKARPPSLTIQISEAVFSVRWICLVS